MFYRARKIRFMNLTRCNNMFCNWIRLPTAVRSYNDNIIINLLDDRKNSVYDVT